MQVTAAVANVEALDPMRATGARAEPVENHTQMGRPARTSVGATASHEVIGKDFGRGDEEIRVGITGDFNLR